MLCHFFGRAKGLINGNHIVTVHGDRVPTECFVLGFQVAHIHHFAHGAIDLDVVEVHHYGQVAKAPVSRAGSGLPDLALLAFPVARGAIDPRVPTIQARTQGHALGHGKARPQTTRGEINSQVQVAVGMALQGGAHLAEAQEGIL